jgi:HK97 gp10 family phage protein
MATSDQNIAGGRELAELLQTLPVKMEKNIMRGALRAGAAVLREEVKRNAPVATGALRDSVRISTRARKGQVSASVKVGNSIAWYAHLIEFGTRPHVITAKPGSALNVNGTEVKKVKHPGIVGRPFIRPAVDHQLPAALAAVTARVRQRLTKQGINVPDPVPAGEAEA